VVVSKPLVLKYGSYPITAWSIAIASVPMIAALASAETLDTVASMSFGLWLDMAFMVVLSTFVATITWNYGAAHLSAAAAGSSLYLVPILAVVSGNLFLAEPVTLDMVLGGLLILLGVAVAQFGPLLRRSHRVGSTLQA
jgi:drug/metabolite transporter (DMT)-like permease